MSWTDIKQLLARNIYDALVNANSPSATNPYLTSTGSGAIIFLSGSIGDSNTVSNTNAETDITTNNYELIIPANTLLVGTRIRVSCYGRWGTNATAKNINFRFKKNAVNFVTSKAIAFPINETNRGITMSMLMTVRSIGALGDMTVGLNVFAESSGSGAFYFGDTVASVTPVALDTTIANTIGFSVQWSGGAPAASQTITFEDILYERLVV